MVECETFRLAEKATLNVTGKHITKKKKSIRKSHEAWTIWAHSGPFITQLPYLNKRVKDSPFENSLLDTFP